jgi:hypothetical protein
MKPVTLKMAIGPIADHDDGLPQYRKKGENIARFHLCAGEDS